MQNSKLKKNWVSLECYKNASTGESNLPPRTERERKQGRGGGGEKVLSKTTGGSYPQLDQIKRRTFIEPYP